MSLVSVKITELEPGVKCHRFRGQQLIDIMGMKLSQWDHLARPVVWELLLDKPEPKAVLFLTYFHDFIN